MRERQWVATEQSMQVCINSKEALPFFFCCFTLVSPFVVGLVNYLYLFGLMKLLNMYCVSERPPYESRTGP